MFITLLLGASMLSASAAQKDEFSKVVSGFVDAAGSADGLGATLQELKAAPNIEAGALTGALRQLHPQFAEALKVAASSADDGIAALEHLAGSDDPFLAAESSYYLSRVLIGEQRYEDALPHLKKIRADWSGQSLRTGESLYYQGVCNAHMLQRTAASDSLNDFVENYPDASPRLVGSAWDLIASMERVHRGSIDDVASHMEFSRRKLGLTDPGEVTQEVQGNIITMLDELIARAEEQEQQQQNPP
jgi:hypothetical protein